MQIVGGLFEGRQLIDVILGASAIFVSVGALVITTLSWLDARRDLVYLEDRNFYVAPIVRSEINKNALRLTYFVLMLVVASLFFLGLAFDLPTTFALFIRVFILMGIVAIAMCSWLDRRLRKRMLAMDD